MSAYYTRNETAESEASCERKILNLGPILQNRTPTPGVPENSNSDFTLRIATIKCRKAMGGGRGRNLCGQQVVICSCVQLVGLTVTGKLCKPNKELYHWELEMAGQNS